jgi:hypothetical protein
MSFPFSKRIGRAQIGKSKEHFFFLVSAEALRGGGGAFSERTI